MFYVHSSKVTFFVHSQKHSFSLQRNYSTLSQCGLVSSRPDHNKSLKLFHKMNIGNSPVFSGLKTFVNDSKVKILNKKIYFLCLQYIKHYNFYKYFVLISYVLQRKNSKIS